MAELDLRETGRALTGFPDVAVKIVAAAERGCSLAELSALLETDGALVSEILAVANSALFSPRRPVINTAQAIVSLGEARLRRIALNFAFRTAAESTGLKRSTMREIWRRGVAVAVLSDWIGRERGDCPPPSGYFAGLLCDIGMLVLASLDPAGYQVSLDAKPRSADDLRRLEIERFGVDHCAAGRVALVGRGLPAAYAQAAGSHHWRKPTGSPLCDSVRGAVLLADAMGYGFPGDLADGAEALVAAGLPAARQADLLAIKATIDEEIAGGAGGAGGAN